MPAAPTIEERLTALEQQVAELRQRLPPIPSKADWFEKVAGSFKDDPAFGEILRLGREFREAADQSDVTAAAGAIDRPRYGTAGCSGLQFRQGTDQGHFDQEFTVMGKVILDQELRAKLNGLNEQLELCDEQGHTLGHFLPAGLYAELLYARAKAQFSDEEIEQARREVREGGGMTTAEAITYLEKIAAAKGGS